MQTENNTTKPENEPQQEAGEGCPAATCSALDRLADILGMPSEHVREAAREIRNERHAIEELAVELSHAKAKIQTLHAYIRKYRLALNRIASPRNWGVNEGYHVEIAKRALVIGGSPNVTLPDGASIFEPNDQGHGRRDHGSKTENG